MKTYVFTRQRENDRFEFTLVAVAAGFEGIPDYVKTKCALLDAVRQNTGFAQLVDVGYSGLYEYETQLNDTTYFRLHTGDFLYDQLTAKVGDLFYVLFGD